MPLLIYLEDAPLNSRIVGTGLSKAFNATLRGLVSDATRVCVVQTHQSVDPAHFSEDWCEQPAWAAPRLDWVLARIYTRLPWPLARQAATLHGRWIALRLQRAMPGLLPAGTRVFSPVGVDPLTLVRGESLAQALFSDFEPYLVDDLQHHPANTRWYADLAGALPDLLSRSARVYCITDGLSDLLRARHGVQAHTLRLVAEAASMGSADFTNISRKIDGHFAFFLGSINHLYAAGLKLLVSQVDELRQASRQDLTIRVSSNADQVRAALGQVPSWVILGSISDHDQLKREIATSNFCFLPYSFADEAKSMVETSFPSKIIDYLAYANAILVLAPESSVPFKLLHDHGLPYACSTPLSMHQHLTTLLYKRPNLNHRYQDILKQLFSVAAMRRTLKFPESVA